MSKTYAGLTALKNGTMSFDEALLYYTDIPLSYFIMKTVSKKKEGKIMARIINQAFTDLRNFSPEALKKIESMTNVALVLLPENPTPEFSEAYASIKKTNVVSEINISSNACIFNGMSILSKDDIADNSLIICNGLAVIRDMPAEKKIKIIVNGMLIKSPSAILEIIKINGTIGFIDDDAKIIKSNSKLTIDKNFISNLSEKTAIINCGKVHIEDDINESMLQSKGVVFYDIVHITAKKELHGYIQANNFNVKKISTREENTETSKKGLRRIFRRK